MKTGEVVVLAVFGCMVLGGLFLAVRQARRERVQDVRYSEDRGYPLLAERDTRMEELLYEAAPGGEWRPRSVMLVRRDPPRTWFFRFTEISGGGSPKPSYGTGVLLEREGRAMETPVVIFSRTPGVEVLVPERVEAGSRDFRREYTVTCSDPRVATEVLNREVEEVLLEHRRDPGWYLSVHLSTRAVLVTSSWAVSMEEWDHLIGLGTRIRDAVR